MDLWLMNSIPLDFGVIKVVIPASAQVLIQRF